MQPVQLQHWKRGDSSKLKEHAFPQAKMKVYSHGLKHNS